MTLEARRTMSRGQSGCGGSEERKTALPMRWVERRRAEEGDKDCRATEASARAKALASDADAPPPPPPSPDSPDVDAACMTALALRVASSMRMLVEGSVLRRGPPASEAAAASPLLPRCPEERPPLATEWWKLPERLKNMVERSPPDPCVAPLRLDKFLAPEDVLLTSVPPWALISCTMLPNPMGSIVGIMSEGVPRTEVASRHRGQSGPRPASGAGPPASRSLGIIHTGEKGS